MTPRYVVLASIVCNYVYGGWGLRENTDKTPTTHRSRLMSLVDATSKMEEWKRNVRSPDWTFKILRIPGT